MSPNYHRRYVNLLHATFINIYPRTKNDKYHKTCFAEDYTEDLAVGHVRRLLDIVACTTAFGAKTATSKVAANTPGSSDGEDKKVASGLKTEGSDEKGDPMAEIYPPPRLGQFYDFFSFSNLTPPIQCMFFFLLLISSSVKWFYSPMIRNDYALLFATYG